MKLFFPLVLVLTTFLTGCAVNLPFNNRIDYSQLRTMQPVNSSIDRLRIEWEPDDFNDSIEVKGASSFVGSNTRTRIPTGVALSSRLIEALDQVLVVDELSEKVVTITVNKAESNFKYSSSVIQTEPSLTYGEVIVEADFSYQGVHWSESFYYEESAPKSGVAHPTKPLETAWDKVAVQMATSIINNINRIESESR